MAESGHAPTGRHYRAQDGSIYLNGAKIYNQSGENMEVFGGTVSPSSAGVGSVTVAGVTGFRSVTANIVSSAAAPSTAAGVADGLTLKFASNSSQIDFYFSKPTSSAVPQRIAATSTANVASWTAIGI